MTDAPSTKNGDTMVSVSPFQVMAASMRGKPRSSQTLQALAAFVKPITHVRHPGSIGSFTEEKSTPHSSSFGSWSTSIASLDVPEARIGPTGDWTDRALMSNVASQKRVEDDDDS